MPFTRGQEQSRTPDAIRREMLALGEAGYREVTLLGQNIDAYGRDLPGFAADNSGRRAQTFTDLLHHVHDVPGEGRGGGGGVCAGRLRGWLHAWAWEDAAARRSMAAPHPSACRLRSAAAAAPGVPAGIERIRFATSHPRYFTERLIKWAHVGCSGRCKRWNQLQQRYRRAVREQPCHAPAGMLGP